MSQYFVAGNLWLAFAALAFIGQKYERSSPEMYSFFGIGQMLGVVEYNFFLASLITAATVCFVLHWRSCRKPASHKGEG